jgi:hypothetical protein
VRIRHTPRALRIADFNAHCDTRATSTNCRMHPFQESRIHVAGPSQRVIIRRKTKPKCSRDSAKISPTRLLLLLIRPFSLERRARRVKGPVRSEVSPGQHVEADSRGAGTSSSVGGCVTGWRLCYTDKTRETAQL